MTYVPLVTSALTTPVYSDVSAAAAFILGVGVVILAAGLIIRVFSR
jgi:energy-converting hydrogenase Eha subunit C